MTKTRKHLLFSLTTCFILFLSSCLAPRFYTPNRNPVPLFRIKGDIYVDLSTNVFNKHDFTAGYAFTNNLAAYAGGGFSSESSSSFLGLGPENHVISTGQIQNYGIGYFLNERRSKRFRFELFADLGLGTYDITKFPAFNNYYYRSTDKTGYMSGQYRKIGLLTNIGSSSPNRRVQYGYTLRCSRLDFYNPTYIEKDQLEDEINRLNSKPCYYLVEHGFFTKIGRGSVVFQIQYSLYQSINTNSENNAVHKMNFACIMGLQMNANAFFNRHKYPIRDE